MSDRRPRVLFYTGYVLAWTAAITAAGALVGAIVYPLVGTLIGAATPPAALVLKGARELGFVAFIWAPGTAGVLAYRHAYRRRAGETNVPRPG